MEEKRPQKGVSLEDLDSLDRRILFELDQNSRQPFSRIAKKLRVKKENVAYRVKRLRETGILSGFYTFCDQPKMGFPYHKAHVRLRGMDPKEEEAYFAFLKKHPWVVYSVRCTGTYDSLFLTSPPSANAFGELLQEIRARFGKGILRMDVTTDTMQVRCPRGYLVQARTAPERSAPKLFKKDLSKRDLRMITALSRDARMPIDELAQKCGISAVTARKRLRELVRAQAIQRFTLQLDYTVFAYQFVKVMFRLENVDATRRQAFYDYCVAHPHSIYLVEGFGASDVDVDFEIANVRGIHEIVHELKTRFPNVIKDYEILFFTQEDKLTFAALNAFT